MQLINEKNTNNKTMKTIAILLTVFNRKEKTLECLKRIYQQLNIENLKLEIYLTNDGCTDGTPEAIKKLYPDVNIIEGSGNLYWNRGMYTAWEEASKKNFDFYLWLNDDTIIYPTSISFAINASLQKENKAIIVGATVSSTDNISTYGGRLKNNSIPSLNNSNDLTPISYFNGNFVLIPRFVFKILGNLDYNFQHSKGDFDYGLRAQKNNIQMYQLNKYIGICDSHPTLDSWCNPQIPLQKRLKLLNRPNAMPPKETFYFDLKHKNHIIACWHFLTVYLRCFFPRVWIWLGKAYQQ